MAGYQDPRHRGADSPLVLDPRVRPWEKLVYRRAWFLECRDGLHDKFYDVYVLSRSEDFALTSRCAVLSVWGRVDTRGQAGLRDFNVVLSVAMDVASALVGEKLHRGYELKRSWNYDPVPVPGATSTVSLRPGEGMPTVPMAQRPRRTPRRTFEPPPPPPPPPNRWNLLDLDPEEE